MNFKTALIFIGFLLLICSVRQIIVAHRSFILENKRQKRFKAIWTYCTRVANARWKNQTWFNHYTDSQQGFMRNATYAVWLGIIGLIMIIVAILA